MHLQRASTLPDAQLFLWSTSGVIQFVGHNSRNSTTNIIRWFPCYRWSLCTTTNREVYCTYCALALVLKMKRMSWGARMKDEARSSMRLRIETRVLVNHHHHINTIMYLEYRTTRLSSSGSFLPAAPPASKKNHLTMIMMALRSHLSIHATLQNIHK